MHRVVVLALDGVVAFDLAVPAQVFGFSRPDLGARRYSFAVCARRPGPVATSTGFSLLSERGLGALRHADTVIVPGLEPCERPQPDDVLAAVRAADRRGARMLSICTGAFVLAQAGVLDGRRATTHWRNAGALARSFPRVSVDPGVLYVDEGRVLTSAGVAAGIDLCLHIVRRDHGTNLANAIARRIVVAPHRSGGQAQYIERPLADGDGGGGGLEATCSWALERLGEPLTVAALARHAALSERHFARRFREHTGTTPLRWVLGQRVLEARRLLEVTDVPVEEVAARTGFGTAASLRAHFRRSTSTSPLAYRQAFRAVAA